MQGVRLETYACVFLQTLHCGATCFSVLVQIVVAGEGKPSLCLPLTCLSRDSMEIQDY